MGNDFAQRAKHSGLSQFEALLASRTLRSGMLVHIQQWTGSPSSRGSPSQSIKSATVAKCCFTTFALAQLWATDMLLFTWQVWHSHIPPSHQISASSKSPSLTYTGKSPSSALRITPPSSWLLPASHLSAITRSQLPGAVPCVFHCLFSLGTSLCFLYYFY